MAIHLTAPQAVVISHLKFIFKNTMIDNLSMSDTKSLLISLSLITLLIMVLTSSSITLAETKNDLQRLTIIKKVINDGGTKKPSDFTITLKYSYRTIQKKHFKVQLLARQLLYSQVLTK